MCIRDRQTPLPPDQEAVWETAMAGIAVDSYRRYRAFVYTDEFERFFTQVTPIGELGQLNIGSRPVSRGESTRIADLRAIPWVFAWNQTRLMLPTWYGVGGSLVAFAEGLPVDAADDRNAPPPSEVNAPLPEAGTARWKLLHQMYGRWPFFRALIGNLEMTLAKTDMGVASRYFEPVSYTHLDVYKRQHVHWAASLSRSSSLSKRGRSRSPIWLAVSYTHLDVYKRQVPRRPLGSVERNRPDGDSRGG